MTEYFIDTDDDLAQHIFGDEWQPRACIRIEENMAVWIVYPDGHESLTDVLEPSTLRTCKTFQRVSRAVALRRLKMESEPAPPPGSDKPLTSGDDHW